MHITAMLPAAPAPAARSAGGLIRRFGAAIRPPEPVLRLQRRTTRMRRFDLEHQMGERNARLGQLLDIEA